MVEQLHSNASKKTFMVWYICLDCLLSGTINLLNSDRVFQISEHCYCLYCDTRFCLISWSCLPPVLLLICFLMCVPNLSNIQSHALLCQGKVLFHSCTLLSLFIISGLLTVFAFLFLPKEISILD